MKNYIIQGLKSKYGITAAVYLIWMLFLNDIDLIYVMKERSKLKDLKEQLDHLGTETEKAKEALIDITNNKASLEKFAREEYLMRKPNEEIFVIKEMKPKQ